MIIDLKSLIGLMEEFCRQRCHPCSVDIRHDHNNSHNGCNVLIIRQAIDYCKEHFNKYPNDSFVTNSRYYDILKYYKEVGMDYSI